MWYDYKCEVFIMQLKIENCGKIKKADITINGITVIAGENNTGKSTIGKVLYSIFNSLYDLEKKVLIEKKDAINRVVRNFVSSNLDYEYDTYNLPDYFHFDIEFRNREKFDEKVNEFLNKLVNINEIKRTSDLGIKLKSLINERLSVDEESIINGMLNSFIKSEFQGQINNFNILNSYCNITLNLKGKEISIHINDNNIEKLDIECRIITEAVYIDSPFSLDDLNSKPLIRASDRNYHRNYLRNMLRRNQKNNLVEEVIVLKKVKKINEKINLVAPNAMVSKSESGYIYKDITLEEPINIINTSTGLKTFIIIKMLIENFTIQENGVLILDEPEIHLHPEWQLVFAEIIVLLQKELNLHIILNTHSPYFLNAIEIYSAKHCIADKCKYYLAYNDGNISEFEDVTNNTEKIYNKLARPFQKLEDEKARLGDCDD